MVGVEAKEIRCRARAWEEGGSSYFNLNSLIEELRSHVIASAASNN